jgi:CubicO group peptidase (beta-lactamase class C family)
MSEEVRRTGRVTHSSRRWIAAALALAPLLVCGQPAVARAQTGARLAEAPAPDARYANAIAEARRIARSIVLDSGVPLAVGVNGRIVLSEGFGWADIENQVPVTPLTRMRIGSVSKSVTSSALGLLSERGRLDLDAPVQRYAAAFPGKRWPVTVRQVAGHIGGIRHYNGNENDSAKRYATVTEGLSIFKDDTLLFEPGTKYSYSSYGWNLLSAVVEGASGVDFLTYMRREVFEPLGLRSIVAEHTDSIIPWRATFYERARDGALLRAQYVDNSYKWAGGGFVSNTEDLVHYAYAMLGTTFLKPATTQTLFASQKLRNGDLTNYGMGWGTMTDDGGRRIVNHTGGSVGGRAVLIMYPAERVVVAMLANAGHAPMSVANARKIAAGFLR